MECAPPPLRLSVPDCAWIVAPAALLTGKLISVMPLPVLFLTLYAIIDVAGYVL